MKRSLHQPGYALLVALALVAISATVLGSVARYSMDRAAAARTAEHDVQARWGMISVRDVLLSTAAQRFVDAGEAAMAEDRRRKEEQKPAALELPRTLRMERWLGTVKFTAVMRDESARLNVNAVYKQQGRSIEAMRATVLAAIHGPGGPGELSLRPHRFDEDRRLATQGGPPRRMFNSFGQVFDATPSQLMGQAVDDSGLVSELTCWGSERINPMRASMTTLRVGLARWLSESDIQRALSAWRSRPEISLRALLVASARPGQRTGVQDATIDQSDCYSVWITATSRAAQKHAWAIVQNDDDGPATFEFAW